MFIHFCVASPDSPHIGDSRTNVFLYCWLHYLFATSNHKQRSTLRKARPVVAPGERDVMCSSSLTDVYPSIHVPAR